MSKDFYKNIINGLKKQFKEDKVILARIGKMNDIMGIKWRDKHLQAIAYLCENLDSMIYYPFKKYCGDTSFGFQKEKFKQIIEDTINKLRGE